MEVPFDGGEHVKPRAVIGIDPGKSGFLCLLPMEVRQQARFEPMPMIVPAGGKGKRRYNVPALIRILRGWRDSYDVVLVAVERQQVHPGQGSVSCFSIGEGFGLLVGIVMCLGLSLECPHPRTWQRIIHKDTPGKDPKARSLEVAGRLFPNVDLRASERCRVPHDGKADSLLIAAWAKRRVIGV